MQPVTRILTVVDPTASTHPAIDKTAQLAKQWNASVELFVCDFRAGLDAPQAERARQGLLDHRRALLDELAAPLRRARIDTRIDAAFDNPLHEGLLRKIAAARPDLVVKDTHYHNLIRRTLITNTDWHLIRGCSAPLLLVKPTHWGGRLRTLAAVDPGHATDHPAALDREICAWSAGLAAALNGETFAVHMYLPNSLLLAGAVAGGMPLAAGNIADQEALEAERRARWQQVQAITAPHGIALEHTRVVVGSAVDLMAEEAERVRADVVVMGAVSRSGLQRVFVGHTAERVLDHLPCDVMIVKAGLVATEPA
jgi:universal stress protein E